VISQGRLFFRTFIVELPDPGAAMELGLKETVRLLPCPETDREIGLLKPPGTAVVDRRSSG
jgi:hypothetical protein